MKQSLLLFILVFTSISGFADKYIWNQKASYPLGGRHRCTAISIGNKGYLGLGHVNSGSISIAYHDWWEFDPATNSWTQKADYPQDRFAVVGFTIGNKGYIGSGNEQSFGDRNEFYQFDPVLNVWTTKANFPFPAGGNIAFEIGGTGYMGLGNGYGLYSYNPITDIWTSVSVPISPADYSSVFVLNNKAYILPQSSNQLYEFNPATGITNLKASFIGLPRYAATGFAVRGQGYIGFGQVYDVSSGTWNQVKDFYFYDPILDVWDTIPKSFPGVRRNFCPSFVIGDNAYMGTGSNGTNLSDVWAYEWKVSVGIDEQNKQNLISIYPNPTSENLTIKLSDEQLQLNPIFKLFQLDGKEVFSETIINNQSVFNISKLSKGIYISTITNSTYKQIVSQKIIIN